MGYQQQTSIRAGALGVVITAGTAVLAVALLRAAARSWPGWGSAPVSDGLWFLVLVSAGLLAGWASLILTLATLSVMPGIPAPAIRERILERGPWAARGAATALLAISGVSLAVPAVADGVPVATPAAVVELAPAPSQAAAPGSTGEDLPGPGWTPTPTPPPRAPVGEIALVSGPSSGPGQAVTEPAPVVVQRGDTLWAIAGEHLGPHSSPAEIAAEWPRWYAANRDVIGEDPDLILPGQALRPPPEAGR